MSAYPRVVARMVILFALIAGTVVILKPVKAEAFICGAVCKQERISCFAGCGTDLTCKGECAAAFSACCLSQ